MALACSGPSSAPGGPATTGIPPTDGPDIQAAVPTALSIAFPPVGTAPSPGQETELQFSTRHLQALRAPSVRFSQSWRVQETEPGNISWSGLDARVEAFNKAGIRILLTVESDGPDWQCGARNERSCVFNDLEAFRKYVADLARRYRGRIERIQFGNEAFSSYWYPGSSEEFVAAANAFYDAVKSEAPEMEVVLTGMQTSLLHVLSVCRYGMPIPTLNPVDSTLMAEKDVAFMCGKPVSQEMMDRASILLSRVRYDIIDIHLYDNPDVWVAYREMLTRVAAGVPVLASEIGAPNKRYEPLDDAFHAARIAQILSIMPSLNLLDAYYFKLVEYSSVYDMEHEKSGLLSYPELRAKPAYALVREYNSSVGRRPYR